MLKRDVNTYLNVRRAAGFELQSAEYYLRDFTRFAMARGDTHVVAQTAIAWATQGTSEAQRHNRLMTLSRFVRFMHAENRRHELPPDDVFCGRREPLPTSFMRRKSGALSPELVNWVPLALCVPTPTAPCLACSPQPGCAPQRLGPCTCTTSPRMGS